MVDTQHKNPLFDYFPPKSQYIGLISVPHSGTLIPKEFQPYLVDNKIALQQDVDFFVHKLIDIEQLQNAGIAVIKANIIRTCVDLNRSPETCVLNWKENSRGIKIVKATPAPAVADKLRQHFYSPYYEMLKALIHELEMKQSHANIVDLHSMPSKATAYHLKQKPNQPLTRPDFCISDQFGLTCRPEFIQFIQNKLAMNYDKVLINDPYKGGHITQHIHEAFPGVDNIQIEIKRELYMDEQNFELNHDHSQLKTHLTQALLELFNHFSD